ncbi:MAG: RNA polymerase sigma factor [Thermoleophilia bacterium]|nr:RNA polymerase sigma factor [Thermoleophilia bacterium]
MTVITDTDADLVREAQAGSRPAMEALFERHWPRAWRAAYGVLGDRQRADDAAQAAMVRALERIGSLRDGGAFGAWLMRIVVREALDGRRRTRREAPLDDAASLPAGDAPEVPDPALARALRALGPDRRAVVVLHFWLGHPLPEVAEILGVPQGTVHSRLSRALTQLRTHLEVPHGN